MGTGHSHSLCSCCSSMCRRDFMGTVGASAVALSAGMMDVAAAAAADQPAAPGKPRIRAVFLRPKTDRYWMGWPGASYDINARQADYTKTLSTAAQKLGVQLEVDAEPVADAASLGTLLEQCKQSPPEGIILTVMGLHPDFWPHANRFVKERGDIPTIVFSPMGTSFTGHLQASRNAPKTFVAATQDFGWLATGLRMLKTIWDMKTTRLCILRGDKTEDVKLDVIGTTLHIIPVSRWVEEFKKAETSDEVKALADHFSKVAKKTVEPTAQDVLNSAKSYVIARRIMAAENCQGISVDCLPLVGGRQIPCPPCMAWLTLNDEGSVGACEADWNAAISLRLTALLCQRPGFMQDPAPNTVNNTLMGAHCSSPTKLRGFDQPPEPMILRSHSESNIGVSPQVIWPVGEPVTVMKFEGPGTIILGTGKVVANIDTPPSGGCRTSVELAMDNKPDALDCRGFHQLFVYGKVEPLYRAYCQLAGIKVAPV